MTRTKAAMTETLYEHDFYAWSTEQAGLLRAGKLAEADCRASRPSGAPFREGPLAHGQPRKGGAGGATGRGRVRPRGAGGHGYEPTGLRYFRLEPDGAIHYVTEADLAAQAHHPRALRSLFDNVELRFRAEADGSPGREGVLRHIAFNLDDEHLRADPALLAHLAAKGKVAAMTKAATHLLWTDHFGLVRGYLLEHADWMVSDSTGIPPRFTQPAGFTQDTYGKFDGPSPFGQPNGRDASDFKRLFESEPARELAFRYGYPDKDGHAHLIVTHR